MLVCLRLSWFGHCKVPHPRTPLSPKSSGLWNQTAAPTPTEFRELRGPEARAVGPQPGEVWVEF